MPGEIKETTPTPDGAQVEPKPTEPTPKVEGTPPVVEPPKEDTTKTEPPKEDNSQEIKELQEKIKELEIQNVGLAVALETGLDSHNAEAVLKLADLSTVYDKNGKLNRNSLKSAINKVLEDYPVFKPQNNQPSGIVIGGAGNSPIPQGQTKTDKPIAQKRWNRFNN